MPQLKPAEALSKLPGPAGSRLVQLFGQGSLSIEFFAPWGVDPQTPHSRDEVYFVISGHGMFVDGDQRYPVAPGDVLVVAAGVPHRFEEFNDDFAVWVLFYGPEGGEARA